MAENNNKNNENKSELIENKSQIIEDSPVVKRGRGRPRLDPNRPIAPKEVNISQNIYKKALKYQTQVGKDNITISGLARELGFLDSRDIIEAAKRSDDRGRGARQALSLCEEKDERELTGKFSAGATVALKQLGWKDTQVIQAESKSVNVNISLSASLDELSSKLVPVMAEEVV